MKKLLFLLLFMPIISSAQIKQYGPVITLGGAIFTTGALTTPNEKSWDASSSSYKSKGLFEQGAKSWAFGFGVAVTITGLITMSSKR
jgi:hypothetical protein